MGFWQRGNTGLSSTTRRQSATFKMNVGISNLAQHGLALARFVSRAIALVGMLLIRCYQTAVRPHLVGSCKFYPSCSDFGIEALSIHGPVRGSFLTIARILRCNPFSVGGIDPVPVPQRRQVGASGD